MARKLRVYGWLGARPHDMPVSRPTTRHEARCIVAATSKSEVARICGMPHAGQRYFHNLGETGNEQEIEMALAEPGTVFFQDTYNHTPGERVYKPHPYNGNSRP